MCGQRLSSATTSSPSDTTSTAPPGVLTTVQRLVLASALSAERYERMNFARKALALDPKDPAAQLLHGELIGSGPAQIGLMVLLAMSAAVILGGGPLLVTEAAVSAILLVVLEPVREPGGGAREASSVETPSSTNITITSLRAAISWTSLRDAHPALYGGQPPVWTDVPPMQS